jgi:hypothetical protein
LGFTFPYASLCCFVSSYSPDILFQISLQTKKICSVRTFFSFFVCGVMLEMLSLLKDFYLMIVDLSVLTFHYYHYLTKCDHISTLLLEKLSLQQFKYPSITLSMYFWVKNILKNNCYHSFKHLLTPPALQHCLVRESIIYICSH